MRIHVDGQMHLALLQMPFTNSVRRAGFGGVVILHAAIALVHRRGAAFFAVALFIAIAMFTATVLSIAKGMAHA
jgi:hypothetical protein